MLLSLVLRLLLCVFLCIFFFGFDDGLLLLLLLVSVVVLGGNKIVVATKTWARTMFVNDISMTASKNDMKIIHIFFIGFEVLPLLLVIFLINITTSQLLTM